MNDRNAYDSGALTQSGDIMQIEHALVEDVFTPNSRTGYILISFATPGDNDMIFVELLRLNINWNTVLINQYHESISLCSVRRGMFVDATFSAHLTNTTPPQSDAYQVVTLVEISAISVTTDRIVSVDADNGILYTGDPNNINDQIRFVLSDSAQILDPAENQVDLQTLQPGQLVRIEHANFMTASIPPQTTAFFIQILSY